MSHLWESGFSVRQPSWHGLANVIAEYPTDRHEARKLAGADFEILAETPKYTHVTPAGVETRDDSDYQRLFRSDTGMTLAYTTDSYEIIPIDNFFETLEIVLDDKDILFETAGVLDDGKKIWALARSKRAYQLAGDNSETYPYVALLSRNDGMGAMQIIPTNVRVICANTFRYAEMLGHKNGGAFSIWHTKNWKDQRENVAQAMKGAGVQHHKYQQLCEELIGIKVSAKQTEKFVEMFFPYAPEGTQTDRVKKNIDDARDKMRLLAYEPTNDQIMGTAYGLVQMAGEYLDHVRPSKTAMTYFGRTLIKPQALKARAMSLALEATGRKPANFTAKLASA